VLTWAYHPTADILDLCVSDGRLFAAEAGAGGTALALSLRTGGLIWFYKTDGNVQAVASVRGYPVFGMHGDWVAPKRNQPMSEHGSSSRIQRHKLFMLSRKGVLQRWNPNLTSTAGVLGVWALRGSNGSVYVGGDFTAVHGVTQERFAILRGS
jgi:outer membrane protein assembly factor BamB